MSEGISVLIVDDEPAIASLLERYVRRMGHTVDAVTTGAQALVRVRERHYDLVLTDLKMPGPDGLAVLDGVKQASPDTAVVIITGYGNVQNTVDAMKRGADDYLTKPVKFEKLALVIEGVRNGLDGVNRHLAQLSGSGLGDIVGTAEGMQKAYRLALKAAQSDLTVLIQGENGTGKELFARAIHEHGPRLKRPFVAIECSVLNTNIIESELFGHKKGAFTNATSDKDGLLKTAANGTVFLDEISEIPVETQAKLLRAIQEREFRPVGSTASIPLKARIVAATNVDLARAVQDGMFREDLFYRLHVLPLRIPPLRERREDVPLLTEHFMDAYRDANPAVDGITAPAMRALSRYGWPGNVRELENCVKSALVYTDNQRIDVEDLPEAVRDTSAAAPVSASRVKPLKEMEREMIGLALKETGGDKQRAALLLGIGVSTLYKKVKDYGIGAKATSV